MVVKILFQDFKIMPPKSKKGAENHRAPGTSIKNPYYLDEYSFCFLPECFKAACAAANRAIGTR